MENCQITVTNECSRLASIRGRENRMLVWPLTKAGTDCLDRIGLRIGSDRTGNSPSIQSYTKSNCLLVVVRLRETRLSLLVNENNVSDTWRGHSLIDNMSSVAIVPCSFPRFFKRLLSKEAFNLGSVKNKTNSEESMSRNLARQISRDLLSDSKSKLRSIKISQPFSLNRNLVFRHIARLAVSQIILLIPHLFVKFSLFSLGSFSKSPLLPRVREIKFWPCRDGKKHKLSPPSPIRAMSRDQASFWKL